MRRSERQSDIGAGAEAGESEAARLEFIERGLYAAVRCDWINTGSSQVIPSQWRSS